MNWRSMVGLHCRDSNAKDVEVFESVERFDLNEDFYLMSKVMSFVVAHSIISPKKQIAIIKNPINVLVVIIPSKVSFR